MKTVINLLAFVLFLFWLGILVGLVLVNVAASIWCAVAGLHAAIIGWQAHRKWLREETRPLRVVSASSIAAAAAADNLPPVLPPVLPARLFDYSDTTDAAEMHCPLCAWEEALKAGYRYSDGSYPVPNGQPRFCERHTMSKFGQAAIVRRGYMALINRLRDEEGA